VENHPISLANELRSQLVFSDLPITQQILANRNTKYGVILLHANYVSRRKRTCCAQPALHTGAVNPLTVDTTGAASTQVLIEFAKFNFILLAVLYVSRTQLIRGRKPS
jgi:hypothetical protein